MGNHSTSTGSLLAAACAIAATLVAAPLAAQDPPAPAAQTTEPATARPDGLSPTAATSALDEALGEVQRLRDRAARLRAEAAGLKGHGEEGDDRAEAADDLADELDDLAGDLQDKIDSAREDLPTPADSGLRRDLRAVRDTIVYVTKTGVREFIRGFRGATSDSRQRGFGGGLAFSVAVHALDMKPVYDLFQGNPQLKQLGLPVYDSYETMVMLGGEGRAGVGHGLRIGGAGWGGRLQRSATRSVVVGTSTVDSVHGAEVSVGLGGLLIEKAFVTGRFSWVLGGMIGGGAMDVTIRRGEGAQDIFSDRPADSDSLSDKQIGSGFIDVELHGGSVITLLPWLHLGLDVSCPFFISPTGFRDAFGRSLGGSYISISPGGRLRIVLGNIG